MPANSSLPDVLPSDCTEGIILPLISEEEWSVAIRATLYLIALFYFFLGVAVITEYVMASSSVITSLTKRIYLSKPPDAEPQRVDGSSDVIEVRVWHETIINLTLMAFSTSATEILLCTIEIITNNFDHGELGPATIVGSAAFNMLVITSISMVSLPGKETRKIESLQVYIVSIIFSLVGYVWIVMIVRYITPDVVSLWESIMTLLMFPLFIFLVWLSHHDWPGCRLVKYFHPQKRIIQHHKSVEEMRKLDDELLKDGKLDRENLAKLVHKLKMHSGLTDNDAATVAAFKLLQNQPHSTIWYRIGGVRSLTAGYRDMPGLEARLQRAYRDVCETDEGAFERGQSMRSTIGSANRSTPHSTDHTIGSTMGNDKFSSSVIEFHSAIVAVERTVGTSEVTISRHGNLEVRAKVRLTSIDGTAKRNRDYVPIDQILTFDPGQTEVQVEVAILNAPGWQDQEFFLRLSLVRNEHQFVELGRIYVMAVTIIDGSKQSIITFEKRGQIIKESAEVVTVLVNRHEGAAGSVSARWRTLDKTATAGKDYIAGAGELVFNSGEMSVYIEIPIINHMADQKDIHFEIELFAPSGGARLGRINRCTITITNDEDLKSLIGTMASITSLNLDAIRVKKMSWAQQIRDALLVNGGNVDSATWLDYIAHFCSFLWKALFSLIPPPTMLGGWPCFISSLIALAFMTLLIDDAASTFGCLINMDQTVAGISIVALGTAMPELFVTRKETIMERTADVAMIGTAARMAVNVMLGLGLPWLVAVIYHEMQGSTFKITDPDIGTNISVFIVCTIIAQCVLILRRLTPSLGQAEIGGPVAWKWATFAFLILLWLSYLVLAHYFMHWHVTPFEE